MSDTHNDECCGGGDSCCQGDDHEGSCCGGATLPPLKEMTAAELEQLPTLQLIARYRRGIENFDRRVFELSERQIDDAFLPDACVGQWPVRVLVGHCADADLASVHRMRRAVAEDHPVLSCWDENAFVDSNIYGNSHEGYSDTPEGDHARVMNTLGGYMAVIHTLRQWIGQWLTTLTEEQLNREAMHPESGPQSVRKMVAMYTWHLEHHARFLTRKLDRMLGPAQQAEVPRRGGCGCRH